MKVQSDRDGLEDLIHDVNSKCSSLREAAALLRKAAPSDARELLRLMTLQAASLAEDVAAFKRKRAIP